MKNVSEKHVVAYGSDTPSYEWWGWYSDDFHCVWHRTDGPAYIDYWPTNSVAFDSVAFEAYYLLNYPITEEDFKTPGFIDSFILEHS